MDFDDIKLGDLIEFRRNSASLEFVNTGIFLGTKSDLTHSGMNKYTRLHILELGGRFFTVIYWSEKDKITKLVSFSH